MKEVKKGLQEFARTTRHHLEKKWKNGGKNYPGRARVNSTVTEENDTVKLHLSFAGQRMWTMEFGRGKDDLDSANGIKRSTLRSYLFKQYKSQPWFNKFRTRKNRYQYTISRRDPNYRPSRANAKHHEPSEDERVAYIYTRSGAYSDVDGRTRSGSGLGGKYGLNTEAFTFHEGGKYEDATLAREAKGLIGIELGIKRLEDRNPQWKNLRESELYKAIGSGMLKDINATLAKVLK